ncbi:MAG: hypothetical protein WCJ60_01820 [bacterium]
MSEKTTNPDIPVPSDNAGPLLGQAAVGNVLVGNDSLPWSTDAVGNNILPNADITTTLPIEFFSKDAHGKVFMAADSLGNITPGSYSLAESGSSTTIILTEVDGSTYVTANSSRNSTNLFPDATEPIQRRQLPPGFGAFSFAESLAVQLSGKDQEGMGGVVLLQNLLGYHFDFEGERRTIPTPKTIENYAKKNDMPITLIADTNETGTIPLDGYLGAFADGHYPVGTGDLAVYAHDVRSNDHMVGVVVLGKEGLSMLAPLAQSVLQPSVSEQSRLDMASYFDRATAVISRIIDQPSDKNYIEMLGGSENNNNKVISDIIYFCVATRELSDKYNAGVDSEALLEFLKVRLSLLHNEHGLGDEYSSFLEQLSTVELPKKQPQDAIPKISEDKF